ncbi:peptidase [Pseudothioclava arenosa]|uniref:Peptidase n=1 Tax=Pseudothioclava arenosa TaxID=1795308 RepID=A0A2A4CMQ7_9RHOB|nr:peptidase [Pseudothioclava arenosa]PCD75865.1 peptidase [Pseudothioclava arenosa]
MISQGERAVGIARGWIGTPYLHQASVCGVGTDCLGLIRGIWREIYGAEPEQIPPYTADWSEPSRVETLWQGARRNLIELPEGAHEAPGQVLLFRMRASGVAKHLGVLSGIGGEARFIHAYTGHGVIESPLPVPWRRRIVARFQFP